MPDQRFDELDRERVVADLETRFAVKLSPIGAWRKYFEDEARSPYVILGGSGDWHGIDNKILIDARTRLPGRLIVAKLRTKRMEVYCAPLSTLLENEMNLTISQRGDRQFNLKWTDRQPHIKEVPAARLELLAELPYSRPEMARQAFEALSKEEREAMLKILKSDRR